EFDSEKFHRHVQTTHIDEPLCSQLIAVETFAIGLQCLFTINSRHQITPMRRRHHLLSSSLKIEYVQRIRRLLDETLLKRLSDRWNGRQQRTSCDELKKCTTIGHETSGMTAFEEWRFINPKRWERERKFKWRGEWGRGLRSR